MSSVCFIQGLTKRKRVLSVVSGSMNSAFKTSGRRLDASDKQSTSAHLFSNITPEHNAVMAQILFKLGEALHTGVWALGLGVVSAKGPSCVIDGKEQVKLVVTCFT